jgi:hypothetical protein
MSKLLAITLLNFLSLQFASSTFYIGRQFDYAVGDAWVAWENDRWLGDTYLGCVDRVLISDDFDTGSDAYAPYTGKTPDGCGFAFKKISDIDGSEGYYQLQGCDDSANFHLDKYDAETNNFWLYGKCAAVLPEQKTGCKANDLLEHDIVKMYVCYGVDDGYSSSADICTGYGC